MRLKARIDGNQISIVRDLRKAGAFVQSLAALGKGVPDLLVGFRGRWILVEVKAPGPPSRQRLTQDEKDWYQAVDDRGPIVVATCFETIWEALK